MSISLEALRARSTRS